MLIVDPSHTPIRQENRLRPASLLLLAAGVTAFALFQPAGPEREISAAPQRAAAPTVSVAAVFDALSQCRKSTPESERWRLAGTIHQESLKYGYDPLFIAAMVEVESQCRPQARGPRGAMGLIQIRPATARAVAKESGIPWKGNAALQDAETNLRLGLRYLWTLEQRFDDPRLAVAAYNLGPTRVARMARHRAHGAQYLKRIMARYNDLVERFERGRQGLGA